MADITAQALQEFLKQLGQCYRHPGRLYLVGGSSLILVAAKVSTLDIDLQFDVPAEHHNTFIRCLREISRQHKLPIEQASPDQFIPLPLLAILSVTLLYLNNVWPSNNWPSR